MGKFIGKGWLVDGDGNRFFRRVAEIKGEYKVFDYSEPGKPAVKQHSLGPSPVLARIASAGILVKR